MTLIHVSKQRSSGESIRHHALSNNTPIGSRDLKRSRRHRENRERASGSVSIKRSGRRLQSREKSKRYASFGLKQHKTPQQNDKEYDFSTKNISNSQSLFESRLSAASTPTLHSPVHKSPTTCDTLDLDIACNPREFRSQWANLSRGILISCKVEKTLPSLSECHKHFTSRRFYVIASGVVAHETKLFLVAQRRTKPLSRISRSHSQETLVTRCLCEVTFNSTKMEMNAEVRCSDKTQIPFFVSAIGFKELT
ncbi:hypothetical protein HJC23_010114 [Cyclotella cryptica]|uniref:Beta-adaptin appendage C-terminal subdomain domain-containing protein n=1 Tax=Cyclotella cryptica TaxID=29204 RepID=A0ABD3Q5B3_9STRA